MDIKDVKVGGTYYIPVEVISVDDEVQAYYAKRKDKGLWDDFDAVDMVTKDEIISTEMDDQIDFWKRDSESAHEEIRKLQEQVKILEDSNGQYAEQIRRYDTELKNAEEKLETKQMTIIQTTKRCADLQRQLADFKSAKEKDEAMLTGLNKELNDRIAKLEADKARPVCISAKEVESPKVEALRKALNGQGNDIRRKNAIINALAERVVYLEGEMRKNG